MLREVQPFLEVCMRLSPHSFRSYGSKFLIAGALTAMIATPGAKAHARASYPPPNDLPNSYLVTHWAQLPSDRKWSDACGAPDQREHRGGKQDERGDSPIFEFDSSGKLLKNFGAGLFVLPHGFTVDKQGNVWVTDAAAKNGKGEQVTELSPEGKVLLTLGKAGVAGKGDDIFNGPTDVLVAPNGTIFVSDGHDPAYDSSRVVKFSKEGKIHCGLGN